VETLRTEEFVVSEKSSEVRMRELVAAVAGPVLPSDNRESWLRRAAHRAGTTYRTARALWYGEIVDPYHRSVTRFREAAGRHEARNLAVQFESLAHSLRLRDEDFHSQDIAALLNAARALGGLDRAGTDKEGVRDDTSRRGSD
jgi:hypothetical protein